MNKIVEYLNKSRDKTYRLLPMHLNNKIRNKNEISRKCTQIISVLKKFEAIPWNIVPKVYLIKTTVEN